MAEQRSVAKATPDGNDGTIDYRAKLRNKNGSLRRHNLHAERFKNLFGGFLRAFVAAVATAMRTQVSYGVFRMRLLGLAEMADAEEGAELTPDVNHMSTSCLVYVDGAPAPITHPVNYNRHHYEPFLTRMSGTATVLESVVLGVSDSSNPSDWAPINLRTLRVNHVGNPAAMVDLSLWANGEATMREAHHLARGHTLEWL